MAIYTGSKPGIGATFPENAIASELQRLEPILGPDELTTRHLWGIPLVSQMVDPRTRKLIELTPEQVKDIIEGAVAQAESELNICISPVQFREKHAFDRNLYEAYGFVKTLQRPILSLEKLSVTPANGGDVYLVPLEWVENAYYPRGQINIIPMTAAFIQGGYVPTGSAGGAFFLAIMGNRQWLPAYWQLEYTCGYKDGMVPRILNEYIGTIAAIEILSQLAATFARSQSHSLGIDGLSQSVSTPGPQIFKIRIDELKEKRGKLAKQIKRLYGRNIFSSNV
jgi:hypothetical protein